MTDKVIIIRGNVRGENSTLQLYPGWTLGYDCGSIWAIKPPSEIKNPLHKWMRENKISGKSLVRTDEPIKCTLEHQICGAGYSKSGTTLQYAGGEMEGHGTIRTWHGGKVAIATGHWCDYNFKSPRSKIEHIYVRTNVSDEEAAAILVAGNWKSSLGHL